METMQSSNYNPATMQSSDHKTSNYDPATMGFDHKTSNYDPATMGFDHRTSNYNPAIREEERKRERKYLFGK